MKMKYFYTFHVFDAARQFKDVAEESDTFNHAFNEICNFVNLVQPYLCRLPRRGGTRLQNLGFEFAIYGMKNGTWKTLLGMDDMDLYFSRGIRLKNQTFRDFFRSDWEYWLAVDSQGDDGEEWHAVTEQEEIEEIRAESERAQEENAAE